MEMEGQQRLWTPAVEAINVAAHWDRPYGWQLQVRARRDGATWTDSVPSFYSSLATPELYDVLCAELCGLLGL